MLPTLDDRYRVTRLVGEGAAGFVYHAYDHVLETDVAIKLVKPHLAMHRRFRARFAREVAISARIVHPNVVPVYDTGTSATGEPFVALGFASGGSYEDLLRDKAPLPELLRLLDEVLCALAAIHARALIHQDLKPVNVLLRPDAEGTLHAWVADLGVADALAALNRDKSAVSGTPEYMAPEQLAGRTHDLGPWTDLYAVGLMLYETLAGRRPHPFTGRNELIEARGRSAPPLPDGCASPALAELVAALLDPDPRQRFDRAADARRALQEAIRGVRLADAPAPVDAGAHAHSTPRYRRIAPDVLPGQPPSETGWSAPARASLPLFALREIPLVGRERERKVLWDAAREVVALSEPRLVLVIGESGSGKSRLVESVTRALDEGGWMEVLRLRYHSPADPEDGYRGAVRDLLVPFNDTRDGIETRLTRWLARDRQTSTAEVHEEADMLARWCGYVREGEPPVSDAVGLAYLYRYLDARAWRGGSCVLLEDVHHAQADGDGLDIAEALLDRTVGARPTLVVCTLSAEALARDAALRRRVEGLAERGARWLGLRRLTPTETRRVVQESLDLDPELARVVALECEGDPLAAGLLLREWASRGLLVRSPQRTYALREDSALDQIMPEDLQALARRRVQAAVEQAADPIAAAEALAFIALAGQEPPASLVRTLNDSGLDAILATGIVVEARGALLFEHSRMHALAMEFAARQPNVADLHRRLAAAWQELGTSTGLDVDMPVGFHRLRSGDPSGALTPLLRAARAMNLGGRPRDGIRAGALAVEAADAAGHPGARLEARGLHAEALLEAGEPERAIVLLRYALREVDGDRLGKARLRLLLARAARKRGEHAEAQQELEAARQAFETLADRGGLLAIEVQRAKLARTEGRYADEFEHWNAVLGLNRGDVAVEAEALNGAVEARVRLGRIDGLEREVQRALRLSRASGEMRRVADTEAVAGMLDVERGDLESAERHLEAAGAIAATLGADHLHARCRTLLAEVYRRRGDPDAAEDLLRWTIRFAGERGMRNPAAYARAALALCATELSNDAVVRAEVEAAETELAASPNSGIWTRLSVARLWLAAHDGDPEACLRQLVDIDQRTQNTGPAPQDVASVLTRVLRIARARGWSDVVAVLTPTR